MIDVCNRGWSPQCKILILAVIIKFFNLILYCRNQRRFNNKFIDWKTTISMTISNTSLSGNLTALSSGQTRNDFRILKAFIVRIHLPKAHVITKIIWQSPLFHWVKCNSDVLLKVTLILQLVEASLGIIRLTIGKCNSIYTKVVSCFLS
jgi:hypothetical protein